MFHVLRLRTMSLIERLPPHSVEAEEAVLGSLLIDPDAIFEVASFLKPRAFYREQNQWIYEAMLDLFERREPLDLITLTDELRRSNRLDELGGEAYIIGLLNTVPTSINAKSYGHIVEAAALRRRMISAASTIANLAYDQDEDVNIAIDRAEQALFSISEDRAARDLIPLKEIARAYLDRIEELHRRGDDIIGVPTGFTDLDRMLGGLNKSDLLIVAARPGMGKCVAADTLLIDPATGNLLTIEELVHRQQANLLTLDGHYKLRPSQASAFVDDGIKPLYRVVTALGREIKVTLTHPFLTMAGWRPLGDLSVGDHVAVPRVIPVFGTENAPEHEVKVLAYLLADGCLTHISPQFTNSNPRLRADFIASALAFPGNKSRLTDDGQRTPTVHITSDDSFIEANRPAFTGRLREKMQATTISRSQIAKTIGIDQSVVANWEKGKFTPAPANFYQLCQLLGATETELAPQGLAAISREVNSLTLWLKQQGVWGKAAADKDFPAVVYRYTRPKLALFLNRLFACDGAFYIERNQQAAISYSTTSIKMARAVQHLLLRFGIIAKLRRRQVKYKEQYRPAYELRITAGSSLRLFADEIGAFGKEEAIARLKAHLADKPTNTNLDVIPREVWATVRSLKGNGTWRSLYSKMGLPAEANIHVDKRSPNRERLLAMAQALQSDDLVNLAQSDVYWDRIVTIEYLGKHQVYDLTVPETHNFVADDMIVHNTSFQNSIALTAARRFGKRVAIFNLEMSGEQLVQRMIAAETRIDSQRLRRGDLREDEWPLFYEAVGRLSETRIFIDDTPSITPMQLRTKCRRLYAEHGLDLIMIDYLQLMSAERATGNRVQEISEISRALKGLARELDVPVLAAAQLSRAVEQRQDKRPMLSDLRDSGSIEQDSDVVLFIYRDEYYNPDTTERPNIAEISIAKHRNGPTGVIDLYWHGQLATFRNLQRQEIQL